MLKDLTKIARQKMRATRKQFFGKHPDVYTKMYQFTRTDTARALGYYPFYPKIENSDATEVTIEGKQKIMLGSNNYLGLTNHPKVIEAGIEALKKFGDKMLAFRTELKLIKEFYPINVSN